MAIKKVEQSETIRVQATMRDFPDFGEDDGEGDLLDPSTITFQLYEPDGDASGGAVSGTKSSIGKWYADITIPSNAVQGFWYIVIEASLSGGTPAVTRKYIDVRP